MSETVQQVVRLVQTPAGMRAYDVFWDQNRNVLVVYMEITIAEETEASNEETETRPASEDET